MLVSVIAAAGVVPGIFPSSPIRFTQQVVSCPLHETESAVNQELPAWATVSVHWVVQSPAGAFVFYNVLHFSEPVLDQVGYNGSGSFPSEGGQYEFEVLFAQLPYENETCQNVEVAVTVSYALA